MLIRYLGHSCVQLVHEGISVLIDPFLTGNPLAAKRADEVEAHYIVVTHGHHDHMADAVAIAQKTGALIVATEELAHHLSKSGVRTEAMHIGGTWDFGFGPLRFTEATHSSSISADGEAMPQYAGTAVGIHATIGGIGVYHAGDTGLFGDMKMLGELVSVDVAFLPIGDRFTMGPDDALLAARWLNARFVVPIHYNTFPIIRQDGGAFIDKLAAAGIAGKAMAPGEELRLSADIRTGGW